MICTQCQGSGICPLCRGLGQRGCTQCGADSSPVATPGFDACETCSGSGLCPCPTQCAACSGRGQTLATLAQALAAPPAAQEDLPAGSGVLLIVTFLSFAIEGLAPEYRFVFWLYGPQATGGQWWQFLTSLFLHTSLLQLGFNMASLYCFGPPLEKAIGTRRFVALYLIAGLVGNVLSVAFNPRIQTVGASGCLFGVGGAWIGLQVRHPLFSPRVVAALLAYLVLILVTGFVADSGLNNVAHLGGFVTGLAVGLSLAPIPREAADPS